MSQKPSFLEIENPKIAQIIHVARVFAPNPTMAISSFFGSETLDFTIRFLVLAQFKDVKKVK